MLIVRGLIKIAELCLWPFLRRCSLERLPAQLEHLGLGVSFLGFSQSMQVFIWAFETAAIYQLTKPVLCPYAECR